MTDDALRALAIEAGLQPQWTDNADIVRNVSPETLRAALGSLGLPASNAADIADSRARLKRRRETGTPPPLDIARAGRPTRIFDLPASARYARLEFELGGAIEFPLEFDDEGAIRLPPIQPVGYHSLLAGPDRIEIAVAPPSAHTLAQMAGGAPMWGTAAQIYGLRASLDSRFGDFGAVADLAENAARHGADVLALSPAHALFSADMNHFTPYSPSSRLFYNILYASPALALGDEFLEAALDAADLPPEADAPGAALIDWPVAGARRLAVLRAAYDRFRATELAGDTLLAADFRRFRQQGSDPLESHAVFEALHAREIARDPARWLWRNWSPDIRDARSPAVAVFARDNASEVEFHVFAQWLVDRSMARAQGRALAAGMRIGLISDLAVGMNAGGSHAWSKPEDLLLGLSVGAPPDMLAPLGQDWGLTTFSPRALRAGAYAPFLATLRSALRNAGGVRIDHVLGLVRLWLVPEGAHATEGVYLTYPVDDLLALTRLESHRSRAIVIGEDLGTVPYGLRDRLAAEGVAGMRVLPFERDHDHFFPPESCGSSAVAMTGTHDTATVAGWWRGADLAVRAGTGQLPPGRSREDVEGERGHERHLAWRAFEAAGCAHGPQPAPDDPAAVVDAAALFIALTPTPLAILPLEDALGLVDQPNLPGTTTEHPNWRRLYPGEAATLLDSPAAAAARLGAMAARRPRGAH